MLDCTLSDRLRRHFIGKAHGAPESLPPREHFFLIALEAFPPILEGELSVHADVAAHRMLYYVLRVYEPPSPVPSLKCGDIRCSFYSLQQIPGISALVYKYAYVAGGPHPKRLGIRNY
ncbi:hypothetical protein M514_20357 [Trichuris suis]|uniref:Uncharacterized protein n=1 Tax=Trichuris suis TaxID=68888 RepID=A0A085NDH0_9BILA|nr:hypothetical protein M514_20357 [Trichuris suis]